MAQTIRLLLLCDDPGLQSRTHEALENEGFRVYTARTVGDAMEVLESTRIAALVVAWHAGLGAAICQKVQTDPRRVLLPIVALGSSSAPSECYQAFEAGALDYMPHPVDPRELAWRLRAHLRQVVNSP